MKKCYFLISIIFLVQFAIAQREYNPVAGGLELSSREIVRPDLTGYSFYDVLKTGYYNQSRVLDYDSLNMTYMGNWPLGQSFSLQKSGLDDIFLVGSGGAVLIVDASDPGNPQVVSTVKARALVDASYYDAATSRLYLAAYFSGVEIWDLSVMDDPQYLARIPTNSYPRGGVFANGEFVYAVTVADGVYVFNASDLNHIYQVGHYPISSSTLVWNSAMAGNLIFCACSSGGCRIVDVSDPANPLLAGIVGGYTYGVWVEGENLYTVSSSTGLKIFNISDPSSAQLLGQLALDGYPDRVEVENGFAYIANATTNTGGGIQIVDVSVPQSPSLKGSFSSFANYVAVSGQTLAFSGGGLGCTFLDVSDPAAPQQVYNMQLPWSVNEMFVSGNYAYTGSNGFRVFDIEDKSNPLEIGFNETAGSLVAASGPNAVFIPKSMTANNPVNIMDISDPFNPVKRGTYMAPVMTYDIDLVGNYAFIACWWDGFRVVDFSNPDSPSLVAHAFGWVNNNSIPGEEYCFVQALDTQGDFLYLIDYLPFEDQDTKGLYVFDISDPTQPQFVSRYAGLFSQGYDVEVQGNYAYVSDKNGGLEVIDVSDPFNPATTGYVYLPDVGYSVDVDGSFAYVANYILGGVQALDISNPSDPQISGYYYRSGCFALGATVEGSYVYLADGPAGFQIYDNLIITSMDEQTMVSENDIFICPNPANDFVNIEFEIQEKAQCNIELVDLMGKKVAGYHKIFLTPGKQSVKFDLNDQGISSGIYFITINIDGKTQFKKLIVN